MSRCLYEGKHNICDYHREIMKLTDKINRLKEINYGEVKDVLWDVQSIADDIYRLADKALEAGQSMEYRLKDYRDTIEGLGFVRQK